MELQIGREAPQDHRGIAVEKVRQVVAIAAREVDHNQRRIEPWVVAQRAGWSVVEDCSSVAGGEKMREDLQEARTDVNLFMARDNV